MFKIHGAADDLVEIDGEISAEFSVWDEGFMNLIFSNSLVIRIQYREGKWRVDGVKIPDNIGFQVIRSGEHTFESVCEYSDVAIVDRATLNKEEIEWVMLIPSDYNRREEIVVKRFE